MALDEAAVAMIAQEFVVVEEQARPVEPLSSLFPGLTEAEAYRIQVVLAKLKTDRGARIVGRKVGATNAVIQQALGVEEPIYGHLFAGQQVANGGTVLLSRLIHPRVECEIAFLLAGQGDRAVAVDLPGFCQSEPASFSRPGTFLIELMAALGLNRPVLVSPSMSGGYSLPLVARQPEQLGGFVPVAPVGIPGYEQELQGNPLPALAIWGSNDRIVPLEQARRLCRLVVLEEAGHACYMQATAEFHQRLLAFVAGSHAERVGQ